MPSGLGEQGKLWFCWVCVYVCVAVVEFVFLGFFFSLFLHENSPRLNAGIGKGLLQKSSSSPHLYTQLNVGGWSGSPSARQPVV